MDYTYSGRGGEVYVHLSRLWIFMDGLLLAALFALIVLLRMWLRRR